MTQRSGSRIATCRDAAKFRLSAVLCAMLLCAAATARSIHEQDRATQQLRHAEVTDGTPHVTRPSSKGRSALPPAIETVDTVRPTHEDTMALQVPAASQGSTTVQPLDAGVTAIDAAAAAAVSMLAEDEQEQHSISSLATGGGPSRRLLMPCYECAPPRPSIQPGTCHTRSLPSCSERMHDVAYSCQHGEFLWVRVLPHVEALHRDCLADVGLVVAVPLRQSQTN